MPRTVILGAARTPFGRLGGGLASLSAPQLGIHAGSAALERARVSPDKVGYVVMGEVLQAGVGMIPSRQVSAGVGCPTGVGSDTINKVCASGMRAAAYGDLLIRAGEHQVVLAGGMESMSNAPYLLPKARFGYTMGDGVLVDHMTSDGLTSTFTHRIMAEENSVVSAEIGLLARGSGRLGASQPPAGGGRAGCRPSGRGDRAGHRPRPQGRHRGRGGRGAAPRHLGREAGRAAAGVQRGRRHHRRQRPGGQRRCRGAGAGLRGVGGRRTDTAAGADPGRGACRRRLSLPGAHPGRGGAGGAGARRA